MYNLFSIIAEAVPTQGSINMSPTNAHFTEQIIRAAIGFAIVGFVFFILIRAYWPVIAKYLQPKGFGAGFNPNQKFTLFDVRGHLLKGEKEKAIKVYRLIFKTDQKSAQAAVEDLERNLHQHGG